MKKNFSLKIFNLLARRVYKISKKRNLGWKWTDAQKFTSANLFQLYKGRQISKIKLTEVDKNVVAVLDGQRPVPMPLPTKVNEVCANPFDVPTVDMKDIEWWMLDEQMKFFDSNLKVRVTIQGIIDTGVMKNYELPNLKQVVEDMRKKGFASDEMIGFDILVAPNRKDDGKPCSYYLVAFLVGSPLEQEIEDDSVMKIVTIDDLSNDAKKSRENKVLSKELIKQERKAKRKAEEQARPKVVEGKEAEQKKEVAETLKSLEKLYKKGLISKELYQANLKELKKKLTKGGEL